MPIENLLSNKVAVITGAGRGLGKAAAKLFAQAGASVILAARSGPEIHGVAEEIKAAGGNALAIPTDVTHQPAIDNLITLTMRAFRQVDILVNNAAIITPIGKTWEVDPALWERLIKTNVIGPFLTARGVLPHMLERGDGRIINVTSAAANMDIFGWSAYCASKAALNRFTTVLAREVSGSKIVVSAMTPGSTDTAMQAEIRRANPDAFPLVHSFKSWHEQGQLTTPAEAAQLLLWLSSDFGAAQNGVILDFAQEEVRQQVSKDLVLPLAQNKRSQL